MSAPHDTSRADSHWTRLALTGGSLLSAICLGVAIVLETLGVTHGTGHLTDVGGIMTSALRPEPWGWASLGVVVMIGTPAVALVATALEYVAARDRRTAWTAVAVLAVLGVSLVVALVR